MTKTFTLIGAAGYIAPKHMEAIKNIGGELIEIVDVNDSVGQIDRYFPNCKYSTKITTKPDYVVICTPNYLHFDMAKEAIKNGCNVIIEKPVCLHSWQVEQLEALAQLKGVKAYTILQLRLNDELEKIRRVTGFRNVELDYHTPRGDWYGKSWKGDVNKSGGLLFNIGIHFFDLLIQYLGKVKSFNIRHKSNDECYGELDFRFAQCSFHLSTKVDSSRGKYLPQKPYKLLKVSDVDIDLAKGFTDLHTLSYERIMQGKGFEIGEAKESIKLIERINKS